MKKSEVKKLQLSRETLLDLKNPEIQKVVRGGGGGFSLESYGGCGTIGSGGAC